jgi:hypothetical protein
MNAAETITTVILIDLLLDQMNHPDHPRARVPDPEMVTVVALSPGLGKGVLWRLCHEPEEVLWLAAP